MDKLQPILRQKFWIILGIGLILTFTGWWMATGSLAATITQRKDAIKKAEDSIPSNGKDWPNNDWTNKLSQINVRQEAMVGQVRRALWQQQVATYFWPEHVGNFAKDAAYRSEFNLPARELYRVYYPANAVEVWKRVRPINPLDGEGIVVFPFEKMPQKKFGSLAPKSEEIWDAQEDLWLIAPILDAIRELNGGENGTRLDAVVHIIDRLELMGGERSAGDAGSSGGGGGSTDPMAAAYMASLGSGGSESSGDSAGASGMNMGSMATGLDGSGYGGAGAAATPKTPADFSPQEEFGSTGIAGGGGGNTYGGAMFSGADSGAFTGGTDPSAGVTATVKRYVDEAENLPYKSRGFYMTLIMDHRKVPNLIGELTANGSSPWPMEVLRVQVSRINDDDVEGRGLGAGGMTAGSGFGGSAMTAGFGSADAGYSGTSGAETYTPPETGFEGSSGSGYPGGAMPTAPGGLSLEAALSDPYMARVAIAGLIYLYKPVEAPPAGTDPATPSTETPATTTAEGTTTAPIGPPEGTVVPTTAEGTPIDPAAAAPAEGQPATPVATPAEGQPAAPTPTTPTPEAPNPGLPASEPAPAATPPPAAPAAAAEPPPN